MTCHDIERCPYSGLDLAECIAWLCDCFADVDQGEGDIADTSPT